MFTLTVGFAGVGARDSDSCTGAAAGHTHVGTVYDSWKQLDKAVPNSRGGAYWHTES